MHYGGTGDNRFAEFAAAHDKHAKFIADGDMAFPVRVYETYVQRITERSAWAQEIVDAVKVNLGA